MRDVNWAVDTLMAEARKAAQDGSTDAIKVGETALSIRESLLENVRCCTIVSLPTYDTMVMAMPDSVDYVYRAIEDRRVRLPFPQTAFSTEMPEGIVIVCAAEEEGLLAANVFAVAYRQEYLISSLVTLSLPLEPGWFDTDDGTYLMGVGHSEDESADISARISTIGRMVLSAGMYLIGGGQTRVVAQFTPSRLKQQMRASQKKPPLLEYRVVEIDITKPSTIPRPHQGGHHASPRTHIRRGHWSVSKLGKRYWREASVIKGDKGMVVKDYNVVPKVV